MEYVLALYIISWEGGGTFHGRAFQGGDWWDFMYSNWIFYSVGWGLDPAVRAVKSVLWPGYLCGLRVYIPFRAIGILGN